MADGRVERGGNSRDDKVLAVEKVLSALSWYQNLTQNVARALRVVSGQMLVGNSKGGGRVPGDIQGGCPVVGTGMARTV